MLEIIAPAARAAATREPFSAQLQRNRTIQLDRSRAELEDVFGVELDAAGAGREDLINALLAVTTYASWGLWRDHLAMDTRAAQRVMTLAVGSLVGASKHGS